jgi:hypothetical protein
MTTKTLSSLILAGVLATSGAAAVQMIEPALVSEEPPRPEASPLPLGRCFSFDWRDRWRNQGPLGRAHHATANLRTPP